MNIISMINEINFVANPVIGKSALPHLARSANDSAKFVGIRALDQLNRPLDRPVHGGSQQKVRVLGHQDKRMQFITALAAMPVKRLEEKARIGFHHEQPFALRCREGHKISSRRRDQSSRLQSKPQRLKAAIFPEIKSARVKLVPFPAIFLAKSFVSGKNSPPGARS